MAKEYIWVDADGREYQVSGPASASFEAGYVEKRLGEHQSAQVLDHADGSVTEEKLAAGAVTPEKLAAETAARFAKQTDLQQHISGAGQQHVAQHIVYLEEDGVNVGLTTVAAALDQQRAQIGSLQSAKVDKETGKGLSSNDYTTAEKSKLAGIEEGANNYAHPSTHPASMITQDSTHRFVTDTEKADWNSKLGAENILAGDNVTVTSSDGNVTISAAGGGSGSGVTVVDSLTSTSTTNALSANQGKILNDSKVDKAAGKGLSTEDYTTAEKSKLAGIEEGANNYAHPSTHPASMITQDSTHRFATDTEKAEWNSKLGTENILAGDNVTVTASGGNVTISATGGGSGSANITKNPDATDGDSISTHLTVGTRGSGSMGTKSFTSGNGNVASGSSSAALGGEGNVASGYDAAVIAGAYNNSYGTESAVLGGETNTTATGSMFTAVVGGCGNQAAGSSSVTIGGYGNNALSNQVKLGHYSSAGTAGNDSGTTGDAFIIGNGTGTTRANAFRVTYAGKAYGLSTFASSGADYAEYFEWADGNPNGEDRRGLFVTLAGEKIRLATAEDTYILGAVSANYCFVGDVQSELWQGMYLTDVFGEKMMETVAVPETTDETTGRTIPAHEYETFQLNPDYDPAQDYISRENRPEWSPVGLVGKIVMVDDGTCEVNGFCTAGEGGKATKAQTETTCRVMARIDETHVKVLLK